jgi:FixJ family two-component response regulator/predicted regulator of Ras-like GTPase activity (Roadblock/LC7/MglB family)
MKERTVLLVDDDTSFLKNIKKGLELSVKNLKTITYTNAEEAWKALKKNEVSLLITDQQLPGMTGIELVNLVDKKYPKIPIILITAYGTPKLKDDARDIGAIKFFNKPVDLKEFVREVEKGLELAGKGLSSIRKMSLTTILELISMERITASVAVKDTETNESGRIWFKEGNLIDAEINNLEGIEAVYKMLSFGNVDTVIRERNHERITIYNTPLEHVLLEGMKRLDENKTEKKKEDIMALSEEVFDEMSNTKGFVAAAVYLGNGEVIISKTAEKVPVQKMGGLAIELYKVAKDFASKMNMGTTDFVEIHTEKYKFIHTCIAPGVAAIGLIITSDGNVGLTKHNMSNIKRELKADFEGKEISDFV